jgi:hypothetical protein
MASLTQRLDQFVADGAIISFRYRLGVLLRRPSKRETTRHFAPWLIGDANHRAFGNIGVGRQHSSMPPVEAARQQMMSSVRA